MRGRNDLCLGVLALALLAPAAARAQSPSQGVDVTLDEGTNIAVALAPDGRTLAFDLVGRIWVVPAGGGAAQALTDPLGDARQPSWSPDGGRIAFQAYWDGNYHIWSVAADGSGLRQHTRGPFDHREPHWSPDGERIAFSSDRGGSYDVWTLAVADGAVERVTDADGSEYGPAYSPTGARIAYAAAGGAAVGGAAGAGEAAAEAAGIWVADVDAPDAPRRVAPARGAQVNAPAWSADGAALIYNAIGEGRSTLLRVGAEGGTATVLTGEDEDVFPFRAASTPQGFFYTGDGRIRHRAPDGSQARDVPFSATVTLHREPYTRRPRDLTESGPFPVRGLVSPSVSPDGDKIAFSALGDLWIHAIGGETERITDDRWVEVDPAWSPDGARLAFSSDRGGTLGLHVLNVGDGSVERVAEGVGATLASWSPDGRRIAFAGVGYQVGVNVVDLATGRVRVVRSGLNGAGRPSWSPDGRSLVVSAHWRYSERFREGVNRALLLPAAPLMPTASGWGALGWGASGWAASGWGALGWGALGWGASGWGALPLHGQQQAGERFLDLPALSVGTRGTDGPVRSPDGSWTAYVSDGVLWAVPTDADGDPVAGTARRLTNDAAADPTWTGDSRSIVHLSGARLRRVDLRDGRTDEIPVALEWRRAQPPGSVLIRAGAVWDGRADDLVRDVDVVLEGGRIAEVAPRDPTRTADRVVDATGGVVMPGLIEMHAHGGLSSGEQAGRIWLAYGATSVRCPACDPYEIAEAREAGESGRRISPRVFGTGGTIDGSRVYYPGAPALGGSAQVDIEMAQARDLGYDLVKTYVRLSDPVQRRVVEAAHALGLPVTSHELYPAVAFGVDGVEHVRGTSRRGYSTKVSELSRSYGDVVDLLAASGMTITPTIGIYGAYGLLAAADPSLFDDPRVAAFFPFAPESARVPGDLDVARRLVRDMASLPRRVLAAGGHVVVGTDAPINPPGVSLQAEMEALVRYGGMRAVDVLRATTSVSAEALGYGGLLGEVAPGALADLVVVGGDPLSDIRAVRDVRVVVQAGRVHEIEELLRRD